MSQLFEDAFTGFSSAVCGRNTIQHRKNFYWMGLFVLLSVGLWFWARYTANHAHGKVVFNVWENATPFYFLIGAFLVISCANVIDMRTQHAMVFTGCDKSMYITLFATLLCVGSIGSALLINSEVWWRQESMFTDEDTHPTDQVIIVQMDSPTPSRQAHNNPFSWLDSPSNTRTPSATPTVSPSACPNPEKLRQIKIYIDSKDTQVGMMLLASAVCGSVSVLFCYMYKLSKYVNIPT